MIKVFALFVSLLLIGCASQPQNLKTEPSRESTPLRIVQPYAAPDYSMEPQLDNLTSQIIESLAKKNKSKIAVIEFSNLDGGITRFGKHLSEELITRLFLTGQFEVIERNLLNKIMKEHELNMSGLVDENTIKELGRLLGVDAIASGSITDLGEYVKVNARLISTETGAIFSVASVKITKDKTVAGLLEKVGGPAPDNSPSSGKVENTLAKNGPQSQSKSIEDMTIMSGKWTRKPNTKVRELAYPGAVYFNSEKIQIRLLQKYRLFTMKTGVDDIAGSGGWKAYKIRDNNGNVIYEGKAELFHIEEVKVDVSRADWIEINALNYNGQTPQFVRWIDMQFWLK